MSFITSSQNRISQSSAITKETIASARGISGPVITSVVVTDSNFNTLDDTAVGTSNAYIKIIGTGFLANANVYIGGTLSSSANVTFVNSTQLNVKLGNLTSGTNNTISLFNTGGSGAIYASPILASGFPSFSSTSYSSADGSISVQLLATGDAPLTYSLKSGSSLPSGLTLSSGGLISGTYNGDAVASFTVLVDDAQLQTFQQDITLTIAGKDAYFPYNSLLLNGDVANGASGTFISDASTNAFALTANGSPINSINNSFQAGYYSNYIPAGGTDYFTSTATQIIPATGDFTIDGWVNIPSSSAYPVICSQGTAGNPGRFSFYITPAQKLQFEINGSTLATSTGTIPYNTWTYFAVTRTGSSVALYINGSASGTATWSATIQNTTLNIGKDWAGDVYSGYISNLRISNIVRTITSSPTAPFTNDANTILLTCQSSRFIDNSSNNFALTVNGSPTVSQNQPFTYTTPVTYGSGSFNGSSYLTAPSNAAFNFGSSAFTWEAWVYVTSAVSNNNQICVFQMGDHNGGGNFLELGLSNNGGTLTANMNLYNNGYKYQPSIGISGYTNGWHHIAGYFTGSTAYVSWDGVVSTGVSYSGSDAPSGLTLRVGLYNDSNGPQYWPGYISNARIVKGTAVYGSSNFTPPATPVTAVSGTSLLTLQNNVAFQNNTFLDSSTNNFPITRNGNTTQGSFSPYGNLWSNYIPSGSYFTVPDNSAFDFDAGNFTIEGWANFTSTSGTQNIVCRNYGASTGFILSNTNFLAAISSAWDINITFSSGFTANTWQHFAVVRNGNVFTCYINGVSVGTQTISGTIQASSGDVNIGRRNGQSGFAGYMSNMRIVKGTAVYTTTFTPPTTPLTAISGTSLLTCQSNRFIDNSTNNATITPTGTPSVQRFSPFNPTAPYSTSVIGGSGYFGGGSDYLVTTTSSAFAFGTGNFTVECWFYANSYATDNYFFDNIVSSDSDASWAIQVYSGALRFSGWTAVWLTSTAPSVGAWHHIAVSRSGTTLSMFVDGVRVATATNSTNFSSTFGVRTGAWGTGGGPVNGYISDARAVKGTVVYDPTQSTITVPTAPLTSVTNTSLLENFTNAGIPDLAMQNDLQTVGNAQVSTSVKKYGTGSLSFDGSNSQLSYGSPVFGGGDFTVECWVNFNSTSGDQTVFGINFNANANSVSAVRVDISSGVFRFMGSTDGTNFYFFQATSTSPATSTWYHIALVRNSGTVTFYVNGTSAGSVSSVPNALYAGTGGSRIGSIVYSSSNYLNGYIDDFRVTNGYARYAANFTPPTSAFKTK